MKLLEVKVALSVEAQCQQIQVENRNPVHRLVRGGVMHWENEQSANDGVPHTRTRNPTVLNSSTTGGKFSADGGIANESNLQARLHPVHHSTPRPRAAHAARLLRKHQ